MRSTPRIFLTANAGRSPASSGTARPTHSHRWKIQRKRSNEIIWGPRPSLVPLNARGEPVPTLKDAAQERNPAADRYPVLSPGQQVALIYPPAPNSLSKSARSMRRARSENALSDMAGKGYIVTEHLDGGVRILPPSGWGARYGR